MPPVMSNALEALANLLTIPSRAHSVLLCVFVLPSILVASAPELAHSQRLEFESCVEQGDFPLNSTQILSGHQDTIHWRLFGRLFLKRGGQLGPEFEELLVGKKHPSALLLEDFLEDAGVSRVLVRLPAVVDIGDAEFLLDGANEADRVDLVRVDQRPVYVEYCEFCHGRTICRDNNASIRLCFAGPHGNSSENCPRATHQIISQSPGTVNRALALIPPASPPKN